MSSLALLGAAARAFAMTSLSDGTIDPLEERRFVSFVSDEPAICGVPRSDVTEVWRAAVREVEAASSFAGPLATIREEARHAAAKELMMRAAQAAMVADWRLELQEDAAVRALAEALGLDPEAY